MALPKRKEQENGGQDGMQIKLEQEDKHESFVRKTTDKEVQTTETSQDSLGEDFEHSGHFTTHPSSLEEIVHQFVHFLHHFGIIGRCEERNQREGEVRHFPKARHNTSETGMQRKDRYVLNQESTMSEANEHSTEDHVSETKANDIPEDDLEGSDMDNGSGEDTKVNKDNHILDPATKTCQLTSVAKELNQANNSGGSQDITKCMDTKDKAEVVKVDGCNNTGCSTENLPESGHPFASDQSNILSEVNEHTEAQNEPGCHGYRIKETFASENRKLTYESQDTDIRGENEGKEVDNDHKSTEGVNTSVMNPTSMGPHLITDSPDTSHHDTHDKDGRDIHHHESTQGNARSTENIPESGDESAPGQSHILSEVKGNSKAQDKPGYHGCKMEENSATENGQTKCEIESANISRKDVEGKGEDGHVSTEGGNTSEVNPASTMPNHTIDSDTSQHDIHDGGARDVHQDESKPGNAYSTKNLPKSTDVPESDQLNMLSEVSWGSKTQNEPGHHVCKMDENFVSENGQRKRKIRDEDEEEVDPVLAEGVNTSAVNPASTAPHQITDSDTSHPGIQDVGTRDVHQNESAGGNACPTENLPENGDESESNQSNTLSEVRRGSEDQNEPNHYGCKMEENFVSENGQRKREIQDVDIPEGEGEGDEPQQVKDSDISQHGTQDVGNRGVHQDESAVGNACPTENLPGNVDEPESNQSNTLSEVSRGSENQYDPGHIGCKMKKTFVPENGQRKRDIQGPDISEDKREGGEHDPVSTEVANTPEVNPASTEPQQITDSGMSHLRTHELGTSDKSKNVDNNDNPTHGSAYETGMSHETKNQSPSDKTNISSLEGPQNEAANQAKSPGYANHLQNRPDISDVVSIKHENACGGKKLRRRRDEPSPKQIDISFTWEDSQHTDVAESMQESTSVSKVCKKDMRLQKGVLKMPSKTKITLDSKVSIEEAGSCYSSSSSSATRSEKSPKHQSLKCERFNTSRCEDDRRLDSTCFEEKKPSPKNRNSSESSLSHERNATPAASKQDSAMNENNCERCRSKSGISKLLLKDRDFEFRDQIRAGYSVSMLFESVSPVSDIHQHPTEVKRKFDYKKSRIQTHEEKAAGYTCYWKK